MHKYFRVHTNERFLVNNKKYHLKFLTLEKSAEFNECCKEMFTVDISSVSGKNHWWFNSKRTTEHKMAIPARNRGNDRCCFSPRKCPRLC